MDGLEWMKIIFGAGFAFCTLGYLVHELRLVQNRLMTLSSELAQFRIQYFEDRQALTIAITRLQEQGKKKGKNHEL